MSSPLVPSLFLTGALLAASVRAGSEMPNAVYLDPVRLAAPLLNSDILPYLALTYERELGRGMSITARPVYYAADLASTGDISRTEQSIWMTSVDLFFRKYLFNQTSEGFYFAPSVGYVHISAEETSTRTGTGTGWILYSGSSTKYSFAIDGFPLMFHVGWRLKRGRFTGYADAGLGKLFVSDEDSYNLGSLIHDEYLGIYRNDFVYDANLGLGIAF